MAALSPPLNAVGVPLPPIPANPATAIDISNAKDYVDRLSGSQRSGVPFAATELEIGEAEAYKAAVIYSQSTGGGAIPPQWLANLTTTLDQMNNNLQHIHNSFQQMAVNIQQTRQDIVRLEQKMDALPTLIANITLDDLEARPVPTAMANGCAPLLAPSDAR